MVSPFEIHRPHTLSRQIAEPGSRSGMDYNACRSCILQELITVGFLNKRNFREGLLKDYSEKIRSLLVSFRHLQEECGIISCNPAAFVSKLRQVSQLTWGTMDAVRLSILIDQSSCVASSESSDRSPFSRLICAYIFWPCIFSIR